MSTLLFGLSLASLFSFASLTIVLYRVTPLLIPEYAYPAFFATLFLFLATTGTLLMYLLWTYVPLVNWDTGKRISSAWRQGMFIACSGTAIAGLHLLGLLNWWILLLIVGIMLLIELSLHL